MSNTTIEKDYAFATIEDYEAIAGFKVNTAFRTGWVMARTTNRMLGVVPPDPELSEQVEKAVSQIPVDQLKDAEAWTEEYLRQVRARINRVA